MDPTTKLLWTIATPVVAVVLYVVYLRGAFELRWWRLRLRFWRLWWKYRNDEAGSDLKEAARQMKHAHDEAREREREE